MENILWYSIITFAGLALGSFASVIIHRLHSKEKGILWGRSRCPHCFKNLRKRDLIPLLSYLMNKARCAFCKKSIAARYPLLEITMGVGFLLTAYLGRAENIDFLLLYLGLAFVLVTVSFYDILYREIPDEVMLPSLVIGAFIIPLIKMHTLPSMLLGFIVPTLFFGILFFGSQGRWLGGGDIRLGALMGIMLGWPKILVGLFLAYFAGSIYSVIGLCLKKLTRKSAIAFGPFLALGLYGALFWGDELIRWYANWL